MRKRDVIKNLKLCANDPMWAHHAEVSKGLLRAALLVIRRLEAQLEREKSRHQELVSRVLRDQRLQSIRHNSGE